MKTASELASEYWNKPPIERVNNTIQDYVYDYLTKRDFSNSFLTGEEALHAIADGRNVVFVCKGFEDSSCDLWSTPDMTKNFSIWDFMSGNWVFKLEEVK